MRLKKQGDCQGNGLSYFGCDLGTKKEGSDSPWLCSARWVDIGESDNAGIVFAWSVVQFACAILFTFLSAFPHKGSWTFIVFHMSSDIPAVFNMIPFNIYINIAR